MSNRDPSPLTQEESNSVMSRREMLLGVGAAASMVYAGNAISATSPKHDHSKHSTQQPDMLGAVNKCLDKGQRCIAHCLVTFKEGENELAVCAAKVHEMQAVCDGFSYLVASNSKYTKAYAKVCVQVCKDCEDECMKHKKHVECKACGEACADLVDQIKLRLG